MRFIRKTKFSAYTIDLGSKIFEFHIIASKSDNIYPIYRIQLALFLVNRTFIIVFSKYAEFIDIFSSNNANKLLNYININNYLINLIKGQQPLYKFIYSLELVK